MIKTQSFTMAEWLDAIWKVNAISREVMAELMRYDGDKIDRLEALHRRLGLPINNYLTIPGSEFSEDQPKIAEYFRALPDRQFSVRAEPIRHDLIEGFAVPKRAHGLVRQQVFDFIQSLYPNKEWYRLRLCDYFVPDLSAHVLVDEHCITIEAARGPLMGLSQQWYSSEELIHATLLHHNRGFRYSTADTEVRQVLWTAIKLMRVDKRSVITPHGGLRILRGYYEFVYSKRYGYAFVDFNQRWPFPATGSSRPLRTIAKPSSVAMPQGIPFLASTRISAMKSHPLDLAQE